MAVGPNSALVSSHLETDISCSQNGSMKLSKMSWCTAALRVLFIGTKGKISSPTLSCPLHQTSHLTQCSQASTVLLVTAKPKLIHCIDRQRGVFQISTTSPWLQSPESVCFTPQQPTFCIAPGHVWLGCSCSFMETLFMNISTNYY
ncbi:hypothetical protein XENOCAPTIV_005497 [Xenoophorus captivus]|uniref:Uncharacterized protein n=1 Tax=Xenoophorus captivus TaxID=1517983 RepID=A0ABV0RKH9_9TELE